MQLFEYLFLPFGIVTLLLILAIPIIAIYLFLRLSETALEMVGFDRWHASLAIFGSIIGSLVDIPLGAVPLTAYPTWYLMMVSLSPEEIPTVFHPVLLAVNLGGCIIPLAISAHLLLHEKASPVKALIGIAIVAVVTYYYAEAIPGEGIVLPFWLSPLLAAICGLVLAGGYRGAPPLAYISGTVGTLIGADLLSLLTPGVLPALSYVGLQKTGPLVLSIGGAGVFDGIFLTGIMSVLLAAGIVCLLRGSCDDLGAEEAKD
jgi:uncharacterized membrane protein